MSIHKLVYVHYHEMLLGIEGKKKNKYLSFCKLFNVLVHTFFVLFILALEMYKNPET